MPDGPALEHFVHVRRPASTSTTEPRRRVAGHQRCVAPWSQIGVDEHARAALARQRHGQVDGDRRRADAALAAGDHDQRQSRPRGQPPLATACRTSCRSSSA